MDYKSLAATLESFDLDAGAVTEEYNLEAVESIPDFIEWLEKTNGDVEQAHRLYGLGAKFPRPDAPEKIAAWHEWTRYDPTDPERFTCAGCNTEYTKVEATGGNYWGTDSLALSERGRLDDFEYILDSSDNLFNYGSIEHPDTDYDHVCGSCSLDFRNVNDGQRKSILRYHDSETVVDVYHSGHVAYRENGYFDLPRSTRDVLDTLIQYDTPDEWVKVHPEGPPRAKSAHTRNNINSWLSSWGSERKADLDEYHFTFPSIVSVGIRSGMWIGGAGLWVPDNPEAVEEARGWIEGPASESRRHRA